jgi:biotin operon repressor
MDLESELTLVQAEETEARDMLHFLKNGTLAPVQKNGDKPRRKTLTQEDVRAALDLLDNEFDGSDLVEALECSVPAGRKWAQRLMDIGLIIETHKGGSGIMARYAKA